MPTIRNYRETDFRDVEYVCLHSDDEEMDEVTAAFVRYVFCDYYLEHEPENCFVLDDGGRAVGYVICAENFDRFQPVFREKYLPLVKPMGELKYRWATESVVLQEKYRADYPAHLHIDLLPAYQRQGWGGRLLHTLFDHLRRKGVPGVMLTTGTENRTANGFYTKYGLTRLDTFDTDVAYGMKLL